MAPAPPLPPDEPDNELARAVFRALYASRAQRLRRVAATTLLIAKHTARGLLFSWPLYLMAVAGLFGPATMRALFWSLAVPGIGISLYILGRGVRDDYRTHIAGRLLAPGALAQLLRGGAS